jgi:hypothetical protein
MTRPANTYRAARRNDWHGSGIAWHLANRATHPDDRKWFGSPLVGELFHATSHVARSKYMPHIGKKERARHAA